MMISTEKVLELFKVTKEEINEEMEALLEGGDIISSKVAIRKMLDDFLSILEDPSRCDDESTLEVEMDSKFKVNEKVMVFSSYWCADQALMDSFGCSEQEIIDMFGDPNSIFGTPIGIVLAIASDPIRNEGHAYIVLVDETRYFCNDNHLIKLDKKRV